MVYRSLTATAYQLPQSLPPVTQLANDVQITNCHSSNGTQLTKGDWTLSTNHLDPKNPAPQLWCTRKNELCIQDAVSLQDYPPFEAGSNTGNGKRKGKARAYPTYPVTSCGYPRMKKTGSKSYGGYAWAEESLLPGGTSPVSISNDDDGPVAVSELFARVDPAPTAVTATAIAAAGTHKRQVSEAVPWDERPNRPETTSAAPPQQEASGGSQEAQEADTGAANNTRRTFLSPTGKFLMTLSFSIGVLVLHNLRK